MLKNYVVVKISTLVFLNMKHTVRIIIDSPSYITWCVRAKCRMMVILSYWIRLPEIHWNLELLTWLIELHFEVRNCQKLKGVQVVLYQCQELGFCILWNTQAIHYSKMVPIYEWKYRMIKKSLCTWWLQYDRQVHRDFLITLYLYF